MSLARRAAATLAVALIALAAVLATLTVDAAPVHIPRPGAVAADVSSKATVATIASPTAAAQAIAGPGVTISNATWRGEVGIGSFGAANALLGIDSGVVMTTGFLRPARRTIATRPA